MNSSWSKRAYTSSQDNRILTVATIRKKDSGKIFGIPQPFFEFILFNGTTFIDVQESKDGHGIRRCFPTFLSSFFLGKYNFVTGGSFSVLTATTKKRWKNPGSIFWVGSLIFWSSGASSGSSRVGGSSSCEVMAWRCRWRGSCCYSIGFS